jgi:transcriptional regulator with XRE-family HTH domain
MRRRRRTYPPEFRQALAVRVRALRQQRGWSRLELAYRSSLSIDTVERIERAQVAPRLETLGRLADGFGFRTLPDFFRAPLDDAARELV